MMVEHSFFSPKLFASTYFEFLHIPSPLLWLPCPSLSLTFCITWRSDARRNCINSNKWTDAISFCIFIYCHFRITFIEWRTRWEVGVGWRGRSLWRCESIAPVTWHDIWSQDGATEDEAMIKEGNKRQLCGESFNWGKRGGEEIEMSKHWATTSDVLTNTEMRTWNGLRTSRCCETAAPPVVSGSHKHKPKVKVEVYRVEQWRERRS